MSAYTATVVEYPAKHLAGMKVRTTMQRAPADCVALWQTFGPRICELLPPGSGCRGSYGISVMLDAEAFQYWAVVEIEPSTPLPASMERFELPAGPYAKCRVPNLEKLVEAYMFLYTEWPKSNPGYSPSDQAPCFELYPPNWQMPDAFEVYMPVKKG